MQFSVEQLNFFQDSFNIDYKYANQQINYLKAIIESDDEIEYFKIFYWLPARERDVHNKTFELIHTISNYRIHKIIERDMSYTDFFKLYNKNRLEGLSKLFLEPISEPLLKLLDEKLDSESIYVLFKLHKLQPSRKFFQLINQYGTLQEKYERDFKLYNKNKLLKQEELSLYDKKYNEVVYSLENDVNEEDFEIFISNNNLPHNNLKMKKTYIERMIRNTSEAQKLKRYYKDECQICGKCLQTPNGSIAEAHHIQPYNRFHKGDDVKGNMIVLCPNCHTQFDHLYYAINPDSLLVHCYNSEDRYHLAPIRLKQGHRFNKKYLQYAWKLFENKF
ncbi:HNH endonuclease [Priestia aryabhattai]|uniref:HNH endonuclease n=1 Tax=Priestia aryabhattai TaxID=412384 RepID=UPI003D27D4C1